MTSFGAALRSERERLNTSLDQLAEATKLSPRFLLALESDDLAALPGGIFNKGMVRSYCRVLGLDENRWLKRFVNSLPAAAEPDWASFAETIQRNRPAVEPSSLRLRWLGVLLMVLALAAACALVWRYALKPRPGLVQRVQASVESNRRSKLHSFVATDKGG